MGKSKLKLKDIEEVAYQRFMKTIVCKIGNEMLVGNNMVLLLAPSEKWKEKAKKELEEGGFVVKVFDEVQKHNWMLYGDKGDHNMIVGWVSEGKDGKSGIVGVVMVES